MSDISASAIKVTPDLEEKMATASFEEVKALMAQAAIDQGLVRPDAYDKNVLLPVEQPQPKRFGRMLTVNGQKKILEADSEEELDRAEIAFHRSLQTQQQTQQQDEEQPRNDRGQFISAEEQTQQNLTRVELDLKFKRGEISSAEYIEQSGAVDEYLKKTGIDPAALREVSHTRFVQSWEQATDEFLASPAGADWPGGEANKQKLGELIGANNLTDKPSAETIAAVYDFMKENNMLVENPETKRNADIASAKSPEELQRILGGTRRSSGYFGGH